MVRFSHRLILFALIALPILAVTAAGAQTLPSLFIGTVTDVHGDPVPHAQVVGHVGGQVCGQATTGADGSYGLPIPDNTGRPSACSEAGGTVAILVNGKHVENVAKGAPGMPVKHNVNASASATPIAPSKFFTLAFNGTPAAGANGAAVIGGDVTAAQIEAESEKQSGHDVLALWMFADGEWKVYVPGLVAQFTSVTPPLALYVILS